MTSQHDTTVHHIILDERERFRLPFLSSLLFHAGLLAVVLAMGWVERPNRLLMGDPKGGRMGSVVVNPIACLNMPSRSGPVNPLANDATSPVLTAPVVWRTPAPD